METPAQACTRLVAALEELVAQEVACVQARDYAAVISLQQRAAPIVNHLIAHGPDVADAKLRDRIAAIIARRNESQARLATDIEETRQRLTAIEGSQRRAAQVAPVYGRPAEPRRRLSALG